MTRDQLVAEHRESVRALRREHADYLVGLGVNPVLILAYQMTGVARVTVAGGLWTPDPAGASAFVTPVRLYNPHTPRVARPWDAVRFGALADLVCWHPRQAGCFALRTGAASWLGAADLAQFDPFAVKIRTGVLSWLRAGAEGLVVLTRAPRDLAEILTALDYEAEAETPELKRLLDAGWARIERRRRPRISVSKGRVH